MDGRSWNLCTKSYNNEAYVLVQRTADLLNNFGYNLILDDTIRSGRGFTDVGFDGDIVYKIGIKELVKNPNKRISMREFLVPTVACFHEVYGHGGQWRNEALKNDPLSMILLLSDLACQSSHNYYGITSSYEDPLPQYFEHPHEIAAQYMALKMTEKFLSAIYDKEKANKMLCEYVNLRIADNNEFIPAPDEYKMEIPSDGRRPFMKPTEPFTSMSQVYEQFQRTFLNKVFEPVDYKAEKRSTDSLGLYIKEQKWPWKGTCQESILTRSMTASHRITS